MNKSSYILIACEESGTVTHEFIELGYKNVFSADLQETSGLHPDRHVVGDVLQMLNGFCEVTTQDGKKHVIDDKFTMLIAFPPCTHLAVSGARHFEEKTKDGRQQEGIDFFMKFAKADCQHIAIENPIGIMSDKWKKPTQIIQPWQFGDPFQKSTCLWLKNLPHLKPFVYDKPEMEFKEWICKKTGKKKKQALWYYEAFKENETGKIRSKTFKGIAKAMAHTWGKPFEYQSQPSLLDL